MPRDNPPLLTDEILDHIRGSIKHLANLEDQLRDEFCRTYGDQGSNEA